MSTIFDEYGKDTELALSPLSQNKKEKKRGWGGYIVAFILAFILGVTSALGGLFTGVYLLSNETVGTMVTTISPIIGIDYTTKINAFLRYLEEYRLKEVPDALQTLTVGDIFYSNIFLADYEENDTPPYHGYYLNTGANFKDTNGKTVYRSDFYIKVLKMDSTDEYEYYYFDPLTTFDSAEHEQAVEEEYGVELNIELNRQWKYLLNDKDREDKNAQVYRFDYSIFNGMDNLTDNLTVNVHYATLGDLYEDDLLQLEGDSQDLLNTPVHTSISISNGTPISLGLSFENSLPENPQVKHLTIKQMMEYNMAVLNFINSLTN